MKKVQGRNISIVFLAELHHYINNNIYFFDHFVFIFLEVGCMCNKSGCNLWDLQQRMQLVCSGVQLRESDYLGPVCKLEMYKCVD